MKRLFVLGAVAVPFGIYLLVINISGVRKTEALLCRDETVQLSSFEVEYQQRRVRCSDPESLRYFEHCFRENSPMRFDDRITYQVHLQFAGGGHLDARTDWSRGGFSICMPGDRLLQDGGEPHAWIVFRRPVPALVQEMIDFLNEDCSRARGKVLHLEAGAARIERDDSLRSD